MADSAKTRQHVVFFALGTRGDVFPLFQLAVSLQHTHQHSISFVTHRDHASSLPIHEEEEISVHFISTTPILSESTTDTANDLKFREELEMCQLFLYQILHKSHGPFDEFEEKTTVESYPSLLVFNLFALCAIHLSERFDIPCVCVSPCFIPYTCPIQFKEAFSQQFPEIKVSSKKYYPQN